MIVGTKDTYRVTGAEADTEEAAKRTHDDALRELGAVLGTNKSFMLLIFDPDAQVTDAIAAIDGTALIAFGETIAAELEKASDLRRLDRVLDKILAMAKARPEAGSTSETNEDPWYGNEGKSKE